MLISETDHVFNEIMNENKEIKYLKTRVNVYEKYTLNSKIPHEIQNLFAVDYRKKFISRKSIFKNFSIIKHISNFGKLIRTVDSFLFSSDFSKSIFFIKTLDFWIEYIIITIYSQAQPFRSKNF